MPISEVLTEKAEYPRLIMVDSSVEHNRAISKAGLSVFPGAVVLLTRVRFHDDVAPTESGAAVWIASQTRIEGCVFTDNRLKSSDGNGGAINIGEFNQDFMPWCPTITLTLQQ